MARISKNAKSLAATTNINNFKQVAAKIVGSTNKITMSKLFTDVFGVLPEALSNDFEAYFRAVTALRNMINRFENINKVCFGYTNQNSERYIYIISNEWELKKYEQLKRQKLEKCKLRVQRDIMRARYSINNKTYLLTDSKKDFKIALGDLKNGKGNN